LDIISNARKADIITVIVIFISSFILYYLGCKILLNNGFYQEINIAFDLDQSWYFDSIGRDTSEWIYKNATDTRPLVIKHPFIYLYYYIVLALNMTGMPADLSVITLSQIFHSGSLVVSYFIFRSMGRNILHSSFLTLGLAGTSAYISTGLVLDIYSLSIFWISIVFLIVSLASYQKYECPVWLRALVSIMAIGTTSYLIFLVLLMEIFLVKNSDGIFFNNKLYQQLLRLLVLGFLVLSVVYYQVLFDIINAPISILKKTYWAVNRPGQKESLFQVITVFSLFSIVAPEISNIILPGDITMIDLREINYHYIGWVAVILIMISIFLMIRKNEYHPVIVLSLVWVSFNFLFHSIYQYRGSLFLYSGHFILAFWIIFTAQNKLFICKSEWYINLQKTLDRIFIFVLPFIVWANNLYLYQEIIAISK